MVFCTLFIDQTEIIVGALQYTGRQEVPAVTEPGGTALDWCWPSGNWWAFQPLHFEIFECSTYPIYAKLLYCSRPIKGKLVIVHFSKGRLPDKSGTFGKRCPAVATKGNCFKQTEVKDCNTVSLLVRWCFRKPLVSHSYILLCTQNEDMVPLAEEAAAMKDEMDILRDAAMKVVSLLQCSIRGYFQ